LVLAVTAALANSPLGDMWPAEIEHIASTEPQTRISRINSEFRSDQAIEVGQRSSASFSSDSSGFVNGTFVHALTARQRSLSAQAQRVGEIVKTILLLRVP
jgi:hypothetical protein